MYTVKLVPTGQISKINSQYHTYLSFSIARHQIQESIGFSYKTLNVKFISFAHTMEVYMEMM